MELIYLWVKNYKNINNFGVVLNPNFQEQEKTIFEENKIVVKLKDADSINIFKGNLNIKTIVGTNGSGKSNLINAIALILREGFTPESTDYYSFSLCKDYFLLYKDKRGFYRCKSDLKNEVYLNGEIIAVDKETAPIKCALFKPFLSLRDDTFLTFPQDEHMEDITAKKLDNYFYFDRFRTYDTAHALRELFDKNKNLKNKFKILSDDNKYLIFDSLGYELDIEEEFEWINRQLNIKIPTYFQKFNIEYASKWDLVDALVASNAFIMQHPETYENLDKFLNIVVSNGCFMFLLIKLADLFCSQEGNENIIKLDNLKKTVDEILLYKNGVSINLNDIDMSRKHKELHDFYVDIQRKFNKCKKNKSINISKKLEKDLTEFLKTVIVLETGLLQNKCDLFNILRKRESYNTYLPNNKYLRLIKYKNLNKELKFLNNLGIFKQNFYKKNNNDNEVYSFYNLSTGEQRILRFFGDLLSAVNQDIDTFIFDEMDLSWHPEWQRKMVYYVVDFFDKLKLDKKINIIFTTHSPFILSDMPKENVIMLYRDNNGYAKKYNSEENTFGANIHDLFNNNFFFNDCDGICTMGEFAKDYISRIIEEIEKKLAQIKSVENSNLPQQKRVEKITREITDLEKKIQIIGEPIIRKTILSKLYSNQIVQKYKNPKNLLIENFNLKEQLGKLRSILNEET